MTPFKAVATFGLGGALSLVCVREKNRFLQNFLYVRTLVAYFLCLDTQTPQDEKKLGPIFICYLLV